MSFAHLHRFVTNLGHANMSDVIIRPGSAQAYKYPDAERTFRKALRDYDYEHARPAATNVELLWPVVARRYSLGANCDIYPTFGDNRLVEPNSPRLVEKLRESKDSISSAHAIHMHRGAYVSGEWGKPNGFIMYLLIPYFVMAEAYRQGYLELPNEYIEIEDNIVRNAEQCSLATISAIQRLPAFFTPAQAYNTQAQAIIEYLLFQADRLDLFAQWAMGDIVADLMYTDSTKAQWDCSGGDGQSIALYTASNTIWGEPYSIGYSVPGGKKYMCAVMALTSTYDNERVWE